MEKYLQYLLDDIEALIEEVPVYDEYSWTDCPQEDDDSESGFSKWVKISELTSLPAVAFPPEHMLTNLQVIELIEAITDLWSAFQIHWEVPEELPARRHYSALVKEMDGDPILYHPVHGGDVHICNYEAGKCCPFQPGEGNCHCKDTAESTKHDIELWEEYVYSQGLDPYREITKEEEALFEEEMRLRDLKKKHGEEATKGELDVTRFYDTELNEEETGDFLHALEISDELLNLIWDNLIEPDTDFKGDDEEEDF